MPILDWTRTHTDYATEDGSKALLFQYLDYVAFETEVLKRKNLTNTFEPAVVAKAKARWATHSDEQKSKIERTLLLGLPGTVDDLTLDEFKEQLDTYQGIGNKELRKNYLYFLKKIIPKAASLGINMAVHPDDPPMPIFGLPRIVSTEYDLQWLTNEVNNNANGLCFCTGSLGANLDNDLVEILKKYGDKVHFAHLRSVQHLPDGSFYEANYLEGNAKMSEIMLELAKISNRRKTRIPMRPDHGHQMLDDLHKPNLMCTMATLL